MNFLETLKRVNKTKAIEVRAKEIAVIRKTSINFYPNDLSLTVNSPPPPTHSPMRESAYSPPPSYENDQRKYKPRFFEFRVVAVNRSTKEIIHTLVNAHDSATARWKVDDMFHPSIYHIYMDGLPEH
jgi:hypothetical protein